MNPHPKFLLVCYFVLLIFSLVSVISTAILDSDFEGRCLLYAKGNFSKIDSTIFYNLQEWGPRSVCGYIMFINVLSLIITVYYMGKSAILVCKSVDFTPFSIFMLLVGNVIIGFTTIVAALLTSVGYSSFCSPLESSLNEQCNQVDLSKLNAKYGIDASNFFNIFRVIEFSIWFSSIIWIGATLLSFLKVYSYHKNNDLLQSLAYEKDKLLSRQGSYTKISYSDDIG